MNLRFAPAALAAALASFSLAGGLRAAVLNANATSNNGGSPNWGLFFDVASQGPGLTVTELTTASTAAANAGYSVETFVRAGTGLGGTLAAGPGSSPAGWTSLGIVPATQGAAGPTVGVSLPIDIPDISVPAGATVGVALRFTGAGPRYFGTGTGAPQTFSDGALLLTTGDVRSAPFTTTGSFFTPRGLTGSLTYQVPEPTALAAAAAGAVLLGRRTRRAAK